MAMKTMAYHVNAFTANAKGGNPAGVVLDADDLSDEQMLSVAQAVGFSETAFISKSNIATRKLRFFTPTEEVDLCGHATIASWSYLHQQGLIGQGDYTQETKAGVLKINIDKDLVYMQQTAAHLYDQVDRAEIAPLLGIDVDDFDERFKPQIVSTGLKDLLVPVKNEAVLEALNPVFDNIAKMSREHAITGLHVFCMTGREDSLLIARNFAPLYGIDEESATGTSNGATLCYLQAQGALPEQDEYRIEQGKSMGELSYIYGKFIDDVVWIGGQATVIDKIANTV